MGTIADKLARLAETKNIIENRINDTQPVSIPEGTPFRDYADFIQSGGGGSTTTNKLGVIVFLGRDINGDLHQEYVFPEGGTIAYPNWWTTSNIAQQTSSATGMFTPALSFVKVRANYNSRWITSDELAELLSNFPGGALTVHAVYEYTGADTLINVIMSPTTSGVADNMTLTLGAGSPTIDWGDGTPVTTAVAGQNNHTYANPGKYVIRINGTHPLGNNSTLTNVTTFSEKSAQIRRVFIGSTATWNSGTSGSNGLFAYCTKLYDIVSAPFNKQGYQFMQCYSLCNAPNCASTPNANYNYCNTGIVVPPEILPSVQRLTSTFSGCYGLICSPEIPNSIISIDGALENCYSLIYPPDIAGIESCGNAFRKCYSLMKTPDLTGCASLSSMFYECFSLKEATIPASAQIVQTMFYNCGSLENVVVEESDGSILLTTQTFQGCSKLQRITGAMKFVGTATFGNCYALSGTLIIDQAVPPTSNVLLSVTGLTAIKVPAGSVAAYKAEPAFANFVNIIEAI